MAGLHRKECNPVNNVRLLASAVRAATVSTPDQYNYDSEGVVVVVDVTAVPGTDTVTVTIQGKDETSGKYYTILASAALVATGTVVLRVHPGLTAISNLTFSDAMPGTWRVTCTHSAASNFTYSVGCSYTE